MNVIKLNLIIITSNKHFESYVERSISDLHLYISNLISPTQFKLKLYTARIFRESTLPIPVSVKMKNR